LATKKKTKKRKKEGGKAVITHHHRPASLYLLFCSMRRLEALVEELPLGEAHPPLVGLPVAVSVEEVKEAHVGLLTDLLEVGAEGVLITTVGSLGAETTESEGAVAGDGEVLDCIGIENLLGLTLGLVSALHKAGVDVEGDVDEQTICVAAHVESAEHDVGLEVVESLIDDILRVHRGVRGRTLVLSGVTDGQQGDVADVPPVGILNGLATLRRLVKAGVICSRRHCYTLLLFPLCDCSDRNK